MQINPSSTVAEDVELHVHYGRVKLTNVAPEDDRVTFLTIDDATLQSAIIPTLTTRRTYQEF